MTTTMMTMIVAVTLGLSALPLLVRSTKVVGFADGSLPWFPFGFYQYTVTKEQDKLTTTTEAINAMSLTCPYVSTASPTKQWYDDMESFMDRAAETGFKVHFQLIAFEKLDNSPDTLANLTAIVEKFKSHPALFAWYLADEPDGQGIAPSLLKPKYDLIKKLDSLHPVSMVFCAGGANRFVDALDFVMIDPYPIPNAPASSVVGPIEQARSLGKPIMLVPQSFGGGEGWARTPTAAEERLMTYLGVIHGAVGIQYFVRDPPSGFPYAASAWSEIRKLSVEFFELSSAVLNRLIDDARFASSNGAVHASAWEDRDGSIVVLAANTNATASVRFVANLSATIAGGNFSKLVMLPFEGGYTIPLDATGTFVDTLRPYSTAVYRVAVANDDVPTTENEGAQLVYNFGYEITGNPSVPDGNYVGPATDAGASFFADPRLSTEGRHSLCLRAPSANNGLTLRPYRLSAVSASKSYRFSVAVYGDEGGERVQFNFGSSIFRNASTIYVTAAKGEWTTINHELVALSSSSSGWVSYSLVSAGRVWLDELSLVETQ